MNLDHSRQAYTSMMKVTIDGRPYLKDIHDLFGALITQIQLSTHRYLFRNYYNTFSTENAMAALASLKVSHTVRTSDNQHPHGQTITTITTFHMDKDMAKALCLQFQLCRLMENAVEPSTNTIHDKTLWQLTPKGLCVLQDFCLRTEVDMTYLRQHFEAIPSIQLVPLDRNDDDQLLVGRQHISLLFMIMITSLPLEGNVLLHHQQHSLPDLAPSTGKKGSSSGSSSSASSVSSANSASSPTGTVAAPFTMATQAATGDNKVQLLGNYLLTLSRKPHSSTQPQKMYMQQLQKDYQHKKQGTSNIRSVFSSQLGYDWLMDGSTVSCYDEAQLLLETFIKYGWLRYHDDVTTSTKYSVDDPLVASTKLMLEVTSNGHQIIATKLNASSNNATTSAPPKPSPSPPQDINVDLSDLLNQEATITEPPRRPSITMEPPSNNNNAAKLQHILDDATLRSLFKIFLRANFCEENLDFWIDYAALGHKLKQRGVLASHHQKRELLEDAYDVWATYLKPQAPSELNINHGLRQEMARGVNAILTVDGNGMIMLTTTSSSHSVSANLRMMIKWLDQVNDHIFRLMATDSVPKFIKTPEYRQQISTTS